MDPALANICGFFLWHVAPTSCLLLLLGKPCRDRHPASFVCGQLLLPSCLLSGRKGTLRTSDTAACTTEPKVPGRHRAVFLCELCGKYSSQRGCSREVPYPHRLGRELCTPRTRAALLWGASWVLMLNLRRPVGT